MKNIVDKLKEIEQGEVGIIVYSPLKREKVLSSNEELIVPLASTAKVAIAFCVTKLVEEGLLKWNDILVDISFDPEEDSNEIYPHFQHRKTLALKDAIEVMIACHDSFIGENIVQFCGGWERMNKEVKSYFSHINITPDPMDTENNGKLSQMLELLKLIFDGYNNNPALWTPIINGLVRQQGEIEGIPVHLLNHMNGGLENIVVDIGIIGEFSKDPFLYVLGAKNLPSRYEERVADKKINDALKLLYEGYIQETEK